MLSLILDCPDATPHASKYLDAANILERRTPKLRMMQGTSMSIAPSVARTCRPPSSASAQGAHRTHEPICEFRVGRRAAQ